MKYILDDNYLKHLKNRELLKNKNLVKQIYKILLDFITKGILKENTVLMESKISKILGVSITPIRGAFKKLESNELIKIVPKSKTYVLPINFTKVISSYKMREVLELLLVREAILNVQERDFLIFDAIIKKQEKALADKNYDEFTICDESFHHQIAKSAALLDVWTVLKQINIHLNRVRFMKRNDYEWNTKVISEHKDIVKMIKEKNFDNAKNAMSMHLATIIKTINQCLESKK